MYRHPAMRYVTKMANGWVGWLNGLSTLRLNVLSTLGPDGVYFILVLGLSLGCSFILYNNQMYIAMYITGFIKIIITDHIAQNQSNGSISLASIAIHYVGVHVYA